MKNIHILPTDRPSRLFYNVGGGLLFTSYENANGVNVYITSNEKIKLRDWYLIEFNGLQITQCTSEEELMSIEGRNDCKKIVLTKDQDLIDFGVQAIDDEFLEWFVKNPSCEKVDLDTFSMGDKVLHNVVFPQEEKLPTKWFKTEEIETWIGKSITRITTDGKSIDESEGGRGKLIVLHQCGENKEELISQLETLIHGLKEGFENFAN